MKRREDVKSRGMRGQGEGVTVAGDGQEDRQEIDRRTEIERQARLDFESNRGNTIETDKARLCLRLDLIFSTWQSFCPSPASVAPSSLALSSPLFAVVASLRRSNARYGCDDRKRDVCHSRGRKRLLPLRMLLRLTFFCVYRSTSTTTTQTSRSPPSACRYNCEASETKN